MPNDEQSQKRNEQAPFGLLWWLIEVVVQSDHEPPLGIEEEIEASLADEQTFETVTANVRVFPEEPGGSDVDCSFSRGGEETFSLPRAQLYERPKNQNQIRDATSPDDAIGKAKERFGGSSGNQRD